MMNQTGERNLTIGSDLEDIFLGAGHGIPEGPCGPGIPPTYI